MLQEDYDYGPPSQRHRRKKHQEVASEAEEQLRKLAELTMQKKRIEGGSDAAA